jgi:hypothetical protein
MPDGRAAQIALCQLIAPSNHMCPADGAEFLRPGNTGEVHEIRNGVLVGAPGASVSDIGEPLDLRGYCRQLVKRGARQETVFGDDFGRDRGIRHTPILLLIQILSIVKPDTRGEGDWTKDLDISRATLYRYLIMK